MRKTSFINLKKQIKKLNLKELTEIEVLCSEEFNNKITKQIKKLDKLYYKNFMV